MKYFLKRKKFNNAFDRYLDKNTKMSLLDKSLDEIIGESKSSRDQLRNGRHDNNRRGGSRRGVSKSFKSRRGGHRERDSHPPPNREIEELSGGRPYLRISNLNYELTEQDIHQLFSQIGDVSFCRIEIDTQGNSKGIAYVGYVNADDNDAAIDKFDGRRAAGQVITVKDMSRKKGPNPLLERISMGGKPKKLKKPVVKKKTAEELDAELDNYFQNTDDHSSGDPNPPFPVA